jgi:hypothetical protein
MNMNMNTLIIYKSLLRFEFKKHLFTDKFLLRFDFDVSKYQKKHFFY